VQLHLDGRGDDRTRQGEELTADRGRRSAAPPGPTPVSGGFVDVDRGDARTIRHGTAALTRARMPARIDSGRRGQASTIASRSRAMSGFSRSGAPDSAPPLSRSAGFSVEFASCSNPSGCTLGFPAFLNRAATVRQTQCAAKVRLPSPRAPTVPITPPATRLTRTLDGTRIGLPSHPDPWKRQTPGTVASAGGLLRLCLV